MQQVDILPDGTILPVCLNNSIAYAAEPRLSVCENIIYTVSLDTTTGVYSLITIDSATGGALYQETERGLLRVEAISEPSANVEVLKASP